MNVEELALDQLRDAIRLNLVSFPAQIPVFVTRKQHWRDLQWRLVSLYFLRGWSLVELGRRYGLHRGHVWQLLKEWQRHAIAAGYVQHIPPAMPLPVVNAKRAQVMTAVVGRANWAPFTGEPSGHSAPVSPKSNRPNAQP